MDKLTNKKAWIISVNMGYGHQRTAFPLKYLAPEDKIITPERRYIGSGSVINANDYEGIPKKDRKIWESQRKFYEFISSFYQTSFVGKLFFAIFDRFQKIFSFYPKRDLSKSSFQLKQAYSLIKKGWGRDLFEKLKTQNSKLKTDLPIISTFFIPAFMAETFEYPGEIFCVVCDADISRAWAPLNPKESIIKYFAPTERVVERLKLYGVKPENIFFTGYPLPLENVGGGNLEIIKEDLKYRILNLDPQRKYFETYKTLIDANLGNLPEKSDHSLTIMFSVGGAGAQKGLAINILKGLAEKIKNSEIKIILSAGIREKVKGYFEKNIEKLNLKEYLGQNIEILFEKNIENYFQTFNQKLRKTDILWTKPSELSFYAALGIPIIIAPPIGSQEDFNMRWLLKSGFGLSQEDTNYTEEWLFDWINKGYLAEAALQGFIEGEKLGTLSIEKIISSR